MAPKILARSEHRDGEEWLASLSRLARKFLKALGEEGSELSLLVTTDRKIRVINREWREKDQPTDVLSFPAAEAPRPKVARRPLGDVIVSLDTARRRAKEDRRPLDEELARYLAHGILHLLGHDHHEPREARRMAKEEERLLGAAGMVRDSLDDWAPARKGPR